MSNHDSRDAVCQVIDDDDDDDDLTMVMMLSLQKELLLEPKQFYF